MMPYLSKLLDRLGRPLVHTMSDAAKSRSLPRLETLEAREVLSATISGFVYNDLNQNGFRAANDPGIANNTIQLWDTVGHLLSTTTTNGNGQYTFTTNQSVSSAPLSLEVDSVFNQVTSGGMTTQTVPQFWPTLGTLTSVDVITNASLVTGAKVENLDSSAANVSINLTGTAILSQGGQTLTTTQLSGAESAPLSAFDGTPDFAGTSGKTFAPYTTQGSSAVTLNASTTDLSAFEGAGTVSLTYGSQDSGSISGSANVAAKLNMTTGATVRIIYHYIPSNALAPGKYIIVEPQNPVGFSDGKNTSNNQTIIPVYNGLEYIPATLQTYNDTSPENNFGKVQGGSLSGYVYWDSNANGFLDPGEKGLSGVSVHLTGTDINHNSVSLTAVTDANGQYTFSNVIAGNYTISKTSQPAGFLDGRTVQGNLGGTAVPDQISNVPLQGGQIGWYYNFGEIKPSSISGTVYYDADKNGVMNGIEPGISGVKVTLYGYDYTGQYVQQTVTTNSVGSYTFASLLPGSYAVYRTTPNGYIDAATNLGNLGGVAAGNTFWLTLQQNQGATNYNFGEVVPAGKPTPQIIVTPPVNPSDPLSKRSFTSDSWFWGE